MKDSLTLNTWAANAARTGARPDLDTESEAQAASASDSLWRVETPGGYEYGTFPTFERATDMAYRVADDSDGRVPHVLEIAADGLCEREWTPCGPWSWWSRRGWRTLAV